MYAPEISVKVPLKPPYEVDLKLDRKGLTILLESVKKALAELGDD